MSNPNPTQEYPQNDPNLISDDMTEEEIQAILEKLEAGEDKIV